MAVTAYYNDDDWEDLDWLFGLTYEDLENQHEDDTIDLYDQYEYMLDHQENE